AQRERDGGESEPQCRRLGECHVTGDRKPGQEREPVRTGREPRDQKNDRKELRVGERVEQHRERALSDHGVPMAAIRGAAAHLAPGRLIQKSAGRALLGELETVLARRAEASSRFVALFGAGPAAADPPLTERRAHTTLHSMLKRLVVGLIKGFMIGLVLALILMKGLGLATFGGLLAYLIASIAGMLTGLIAGKPIWAKEAKIEAGLKAAV